ncbi:MAG: ATP-binding protein [Opitutales bacterium]
MGRKKLEIIDPPFLEANESRLLSFHSVLNVLHALVGEISLLSLDAPALGERLAPYAEAFEAIVQSVPETTDPKVIVRRTLAHADAFEAEFAANRRDEHLTRARAHPEADILLTVLRILRLRLGEISHCWRDPHSWTSVPVAAVANNLREAFAAIEKHAGGRFGIVFEPAQPGPDDYLVALRLVPAEGDAFWLPPGIEDVLRDLAANARKYTLPGGRIAISMLQERTCLRVAIKDNGIGIPVDELGRVCDFGVRGSNIGSRRTLGGGFGLTKAVSLVKLWGGRFWIDSGAGHGTEITFTVPLPETRQAVA